MTLFAGIYCRTPRRQVPETSKREIRNSITRSEAFDVRVFQFDRIFVAGVDIGAFRLPSVIHHPNDGLTLIVGDPIIKRDGNRFNSNRTEDTQLVHSFFMQEDPSILKEADGTFAGVHFNAHSRAVYLFTDKFGNRQLFVSITEDFVFFSSALRVLEQISEVPKRINTRRLIEEVELPDPLGRHTPYNDVDRFASAELLRCSGLEIESAIYWTMPSPLVESGADLSAHLSECHDVFRSAVAARLDSETEVVAFLSGGLDSRAVVDKLVEFGKNVSTVNFAPPDSQDRIFAQEFANAVGTVHMQMDWNTTTVDPSKVYETIKDFLNRRIESGQLSAKRPVCIWDGSGGSSVMGHIIVNDDVIVELKKGNHRAAARIYLEANGCNCYLPRKLLMKPVFNMYEHLPLLAIESEFTKISRENPGRELSNFMLRSHERIHLHDYYESIDLHGFERIMPFFDAALLEAINKVPIEDCQYHRFYVQWLDYFSDAVRTTPWQSYPGHVPCPVNYPQELGYQFDRTYSRKLESILRQIRLGKAVSLLRGTHFPGNLLNRPTIILATILCLLGSNRLGYAIDKGSRYARFTRNATEILPR